MTETTDTDMAENVEWFLDEVTDAESRERVAKMMERRRFRQFVHDMVEANQLENMRWYQGRHFYEGPAVVTSDDFDVQDAIRATSVRVQTDGMGRQTIVYVA